MRPVAGHVRDGVGLVAMWALPGPGRWPGHSHWLPARVVMRLDCVVVERSGGRAGLQPVPSPSSEWLCNLDCVWLGGPVGAGPSGWIRPPSG